MLTCCMSGAVNTIYMISEKKGHLAGTLKKKRRTIIEEVRLGLKCRDEILFCCIKKSILSIFCFFIFFFTQPPL